MRHYDKVRRMIRTAAACLFAGSAFFGSCTTSDDTLGSEYLPGNEEMKMGMMRLGGNDRQIETRLFRSDSMRASNIGVGYFGSSRNDTVGSVEAGFMSQFLSYYKVDEGYFGYRPIFDSAQLHVAIQSYGRDTLTAQSFNVYEIVDDSYIERNQDTIFYLNFDPRPYIGSEPLFTFTFPQKYVVQGGDYVSVTLNPTQRGREFAYRLMISDGSKNVQEGIDYTIYNDAAAFRKAFKGLCILPAQPVTETGKGGVYGMKLASSGFTIYARNRVPSDPTLIQDTVGGTYYFSSSESTSALKSNLSVNTIRHDYAGSLVQEADADENLAERPLTAQAIVSGLGGVITEVRFTQEFFDAIEAEIARVNLDEGRNFKTLAFNRALLQLYFRGADYDWSRIDQGVVTPLMEGSMKRIGCYTDYKRLTGITDYDYYTEYNTEDYELAYGGYINRSQGCFVLDISAYLQELWNSYLEAKAARRSENDAVDLSLVKNRTIYLGPDAYDLFTNSFTVVQGMAAEGNTAPVKIELTYTLIQ